MKFRWWCVAAVCLPSPVAAQCRVWRLERDGAVTRLTAAVLPDGRTEVLVQDGSPVVSVVIATGEGQSADMVAPNGSTRLITRCQGDTLRVLVQRGEQAAREVMSAAMQDLARWRVEVHVTAADGVKSRWRIDRWSAAGLDVGPVLDLFQGRVPVPAGGYTVVTVVAPMPAGANAALLRGVSEVYWTTGYPLLTLKAPRPGGAVLDLAAANTVFRRGAVDASIVQRDATMRQTSSAGVELLALSGDGAGGAVGGFQSATLPTVTFGTVQLDQLPVLTLPTLPTVKNAPVDAILGLDVMRRAGRLRLSHPRATVRSTDREAAWTLFLGADVPAHARRPDVSLPLRSVGALVGVTANIDGVDTFLVLDTGSPHTVVASRTAARVGWSTTPIAGPLPRGLDGRPLEMSSARAASFVLDELVLRNVAVRVADLPVLAKLGHEHVGLLGGDVLTTFTDIEIDFVAEVVRLWR